MSRDPRTASRSPSDRSRALLDSQAGPPEHGDQAAGPDALDVVSRLAHHRDNLLHARRVGREAPALVMSTAGTVWRGRQETSSKTGLSTIFSPAAPRNPRSLDAPAFRAKEHSRRADWFVAEAVVVQSCGCVLPVAEAGSAGVLIASDSADRGGRPAQLRSNYCSIRAWRSSLVSSRPGWAFAHCSQVATWAPSGWAAVPTASPSCGIGPAPARRGAPACPRTLDAGPRGDDRAPFRRRRRRPRSSDRPQALTGPLR